MAFLVMPDRAVCKNFKRPDLSHIPILFSSEWKLLHEAYNYLIARGVGQWCAGVGAANEYAGFKKPSENSMKAYGRDLENFFTFCERSQVNWRTIKYHELLENYQSTMQSGEFTLKGDPLAPSTINRRMGTTGDFLTFAAYHNMRDSFEISQEQIPPQTRMLSQARTGRPTQLHSRRVGHVRLNPEDLRLPTLPELSIWLNSIYTEHPGDHGITSQLMCRTIIEVGLRSEELRLIHAQQIPDPQDLRTVKPDASEVKIRIVFGTKGNRKIGDSEKKGKSRNVSIRRHLLFLLNAYKKGPRRRAIEVFKAKNIGKPLPKELFLSPSTGKPYSDRRFLEIWAQEKSKTREETIPFSGWSVHLGRHAWACYEVLRRLNKELDLIKQESDIAEYTNHIPSSTTINNIARDLIDQIIRPAMGHISSRTTGQYLLWIDSQLGHNKHSQCWWEWLDGEL